MEELEIKGEKYISSKRAAKIAGYATDYVGQLARAQKIKATRVGRSWYVSEIDILKHAGKYKVSEEEGTNGMSLIQQRVTDQVENRKSLHSLRSFQENTSRFRTWGDISYQKEEADLYPKAKVLEASHAVEVKKTAQVKPVSAVPDKSPRENSMVFDGLVEREQGKGDDSTGLTIHKSQSKSKITPLKPERTIIPTGIVVLSGMGVAVALALFMFSGLGISNDWAISANSQVSNGYSADLALIWEYLESFFLQGVAIFLGFLNILLVSLERFFILGLDFIMNLLNLG